MAKALLVLSRRRLAGAGGDATGQTRWISPGPFYSAVLQYPPYPQ